MIFETQIVVTQGVVTPDPDTSPQSVTAAMLLNAQRIQGFGDVPARTLLLAFEAPATETVTVALWAHDEATPLGVALGAFPDTPGTRFYRIAAPAAVTGSRLTPVTVNAGGKIYVQVTADTIGAGGRRTLKASCVA